LLAAALIASLFADVLPVPANLACVGRLELLIDLDVGRDLLRVGAAAVDDEAVITPPACAAWSNLDALDPEFERAVVEQPSVDAAERGAEPLGVASEPFSSILDQMTDFDPGAVFARVVFWLGDIEGFEVGPERVEVDLHADPFGVAGARGEDAGTASEPCGTDVEAHTEQAEFVEPVVAGPSRADGLLEGVPGHAAASVSHDDLGSREVSGESRKRHADLETAGPTLSVANDLGEVVKRVVDELRDALPLIEFDLAEHPQDAR